MPQAPLLVGMQLDEQLSALIAAAPLPPIDIGTIDRATVERLSTWLKSMPELSDGCRAGLWLLAGDLNKSHTISQNMATPEGSFWHGIMHRREGDYDNAKYWFRRVGSHAVLTSLSEEIIALAGRDAHGDLPWSQLEVPQTVALALVDASRDRRSVELVEAMAWIEWQLLFRHCWLAQ